MAYPFSLSKSKDLIIKIEKSYIKSQNSNIIYHELFNGSRKYEMKL